MRKERSAIRRFWIPVAASVWSFAALAALPHAQSSIAADRVWFCPSPGSIDYVQLFEHPESWPDARRLVSVFKFYQQHTQTPAPAIVGANTYDALARAGAFRRLGQWGKKIALEAGSVKEFYCTPDARGMTESIASSVASLKAVQTAGGTVAYIAMDEPFVAGRARVCGGPALEPTADRVAVYVAGVKAAFPSVAIGLIEAYPFSSADAIEKEVSLLQARGATPAFLHMDVDWHLSGADAFKRDMPRLQTFAAASKIPFGVIITGYDGNADTLYAVDAYHMTEMLADTFLTWTRMPDHLIVQSWAVTSTGLLITPSNLDDRRPFSHTSLVREAYRRLVGTAGPSAGKAIPKR